MKVLIFGATGTVGRLLVTQALEMGHTVTAFARDPSELAISHASLEIIEGDVMDSAAVDRAVPDHDAVLIALGAGSKGQVRSTGTRNIIQAMQKSGTRRLVCLSTLGVGDSRDNLNFLWKYVMFGMLLRAAFADHVSQEDHVIRSGLDWTIVRPAAYTDGELTGDYCHGFPATEKGLKLKISRADVADFVLTQLADDSYIRMTPGVSY
ncbi:MAG: SDR family oxidoreductase [Gammaproteobacteria bacterium]|nr:SDR family oxidoreductase [Gammaproteobacteria bacterium]